MHNSFKHLVENSPFGIYAVDADFRLSMVSAGAQKVFESVRPLIGRDFADVIRTLWPEPFASEAISIFRRTLETGEPYHAPSTVERRNDIGIVESYDWKTERLVLPDGRPGVVCHLYDLSERQAHETALRDSSAKFRGTFENAAVGMAHLDLGGRWLEVNQRLCDIVGYSSEELLALTFQDITHPDDLLADIENVRRLLAGEIASYSMDKRYIRKDRSVIWIGLTATVQRSADGTPQYFISVVRDISGRKKAEEHNAFLLRELAHRLKNQLSLIQAIAGQTVRNATSLEEFEQKFAARIQGLSAATGVLVAENWTGAPLDDLVRKQLELFTVNELRLNSSGPTIVLSADAAESIGLALHELGTNCVKHGAWSTPEGMVSVTWTLERDADKPPALRLRWQESGGPAVSPPKHKGFGHVVIERMVAQKLGGTVELAFDTHGFIWVLQVPSSQFTAGPGLTL